MKHALTAAATLVAVLALAGVASASAGGTSRVVVESFSENYAFSADCAEFGPYEFEIEVEGDVKVRVTDVLSKDGELLQTIIHVVFGRRTRTPCRARACRYTRPRTRCGTTHPIRGRLAGPSSSATNRAARGFRTPGES